MNYYAVAFPERDNAINYYAMAYQERLVTKSLQDSNHEGKLKTLTNAAMFT